MNLMKFELDFSQQPSGLRVHIKDTTTAPENTKHLFFVHQFDNWKNDKERRMTLTIFFDGVTRILRQRMFPKDTLIYDTEETPHGPKLSNPRYPSE